MYTTSMTSIRPGWDSNPVPLSFEPQPDQMSIVAGHDTSKYHNHDNINIATSMTRASM